MSRCTEFDATGRQCTETTYGSEPPPSHTHHFNSQMLFSDPRFRSPTAVRQQRREMVLPWVWQKEIEDGGQTAGPVDGPRERSITGIAAFADCDQDARLYLRVDGRTIELPLLYLNRLWPRQMFWPTKALVSESDISVSTSGVGGRTLVVLFGMRQG